MKKLILSALVFVGFSAHVLAQSIAVDNLNGTGDWSATSFGLFFNRDGTPYNGATINITLAVWFPGGSIPIVNLSGSNALVKVVDGVFFDPKGISYLVPGVVPGGTAQLQLQAWRGSAASYDQARFIDRFWAPNGSTFLNSTSGRGTYGTSLDGMPAMIVDTCLDHPSILQQPTNQVVPRGGTATFSAVANCNCPGQWRLNGTNIPSAWAMQNLTLVITNVQPTNAGFYSLIAYGSQCGDAISSVATLTVVNNTLGLALGAHPSLTIEGVVGQTFGIQATTNFSVTNSWLTLTNVTLTAPLQEWVDTSVDSPPGGVPQRFYRVVPVP